MALVKVLEPVADSDSLYYVRSPILYRFHCDKLSQDPAGYFYMLLYMMTGNTLGYYWKNNAPNYTLTKYPDEYDGATFDVSDLIREFIQRNPINIDSKYICGFAYDVTTYSGGTSEPLTDLGQTTANLATLGYTEYTNGLNFRRGTGYGCYIMSTYSPGTHIVPNQNHWEMTCKIASGTTEYNYWTVTNGNVSIVSPQTIPAYTGCSEDLSTYLYRFECGSYDLDNTFHITTDTNLPYTLHIFDHAGREVVAYNFITESCIEGEEYKTMMYMNRWGMWEHVYFTGKMTETNTIDFKTFKHNNLILTKNTISSDLQGGQESVIYKQGLDKLILNTGFIDEVANERIKEFLLSEYIIDWETNLPYIVENKEIKYKTKQYDKLINYEITLRAAFDAVNSIK